MKNNKFFFKILFFLIFFFNFNFLLSNEFEFKASKIETTNNNSKIKYDIYDIWKNEYISINCGLTQLPVQVNTLRLIESQTVIFAKKGITKINTTDIYDISKKGDVYIHFKLLLGRVE